jgi:Peptidase family M28
MEAVKSSITPNKGQPIVWLKRDSVMALVQCLLIAGLVTLTIAQQTPPKAASVNAPLGEFSSGRALKHVEAIAQKPRPLGSLDHAKARDYILKTLTALGISPEVQKATAVAEKWGPPFSAATVENILARLKGSGSGKAVLLVGHYDSVPTSPGASDDGSAVALMLETLRALKIGSPLKNDVIFLFSDGEEAGLLGANAFVSAHPWAKDVGLVLNFEARGSGGSAIMFETSDNNGWLIDQFAISAPYPVANSLAYEVYKLLPNDTDLTVFKQAGFAGLNFAYINGLTDYHMLLDSVERMDERSLQHQGSYALALTNHFGRMDLEERAAGNAIYFNTLGPILIHYPSRLAAPLAIFVTILFIVVLAIGFRRRQLTLRGIALGWLGLLFGMICSLSVVAGVCQVIGSLDSSYGWMPLGESYNSGLYKVSFIAITFALTSIIYTWLRKRTAAQNLAAGGLVWWLILMLPTSFYLPGASYLFTWPLLFGIAVLLLAPDSDRRETTAIKRATLTFICAVVGIMLFVPVIYQILNALSLSMSAGVMITVVLLIGLIIPHLDIVAIHRAGFLPAASLAIGIVIIVVGILSSGFSKNRPKPNSIFYALNADAQKAVWASTDESSDEWTSQFLSTGAQKGALSDYLPSSYAGFLKRDAPLADLPAPKVDLLEDLTNTEARTLRVRITSPRQASSVFVQIESEVKIMKAEINGEQIAPITPSENPVPRWGLRYYAFPKEGLELALKVSSGTVVRLKVVDQTYQLPEIPGFVIKPRPDHMIPGMTIYSDSTLVSKSFTL